MGRFASTVAYYESARPPYGAAFFEAIGLELGLDRSQRLLDVGAGPGVLAIGFAPCCRDVVGVDPESGMIEAARAAAKRAGVTARFVEGRFEDVAAKLGAFDIVGIGRAIHWLDPEPAGARPRPRPSWKSFGLRRHKRQRRAQPVARDLQRGARSLEGRSTVPRSSHVLRRPLVHPNGNDPAGEDLCRSGRASGRPHVVDVDLIVGAARGRGSDNEDRHARSARTICRGRNDRGHCRSPSRGVRAHQAPMKAANFRANRDLLEAASSR